MDKFIAFLIARVKEPSSWAALGGLLVTVGVLNPGTQQKYLLIVGGIMSVLGFAMPEQGKPPVATPPPATELTTARAIEKT